MMMNDHRNMIQVTSRYHNMTIKEVMTLRINTRASEHHRSCDALKMAHLIMYIVNIRGLSNTTMK